MLWKIKVLGAVAPIWHEGIKILKNTSLLVYLLFALQVHMIVIETTPTFDNTKEEVISATFHSSFPVSSFFHLVPSSFFYHAESMKVSFHLG